jgi:protein CWC15
MTTAHRPTWNAAVGGKNQAGNPTRYTPIHAVSGKDLPAQLTLKKRGAGQDTKGEIGQRDLKAELEERERLHLEKIGKAPKLAPPRPAPQLAAPDAGGGGPGAGEGDDRGSAAQYDDKDDSDSDDSDSDSDDDSDDEEDTAELLRELEKIKKEKALEQQRQEEEARAEQEQQQQTAVMTGNPLLHSADEGFKVKRRWDDDVVFRHQTRGEPQAKKRFVNDAIRNDFHKKFLARYVV